MGALTPLIVVGGAFAAGELAGGWLAQAIGVSTSDVWTTRGIKIGMGISAFLVLGALL